MPAAPVALTANWDLAVVGEIRNTTAQQVVAGIRAGWNLGNTYDSRRDAPWVSVATTQAMIREIRRAGFDAIRIPVTWTVDGSATLKATANNNWTISPQFLDRIEEIVGWAYAEGMTIIINAHHEDVVQLNMVANATLSDTIHRRIWEQVAGRFNNQFGARLIFAGSNEPRTVLTDFGDGTHAHAAIMRQHQIFIDTVRATGGNNEFRSLMIMPHAASARPGALAGLQPLNDPTPNRLILSVHTYSPFGFTWGQDTTDWHIDGLNHAGTRVIRQYFDNIQSAANRLGWPVILGEWGSQHFNNEAARARHAEYYVAEARERGFATFVWDNHAPTGSGELFGLFNRANLTWWYPAVVNGIMRGAGLSTVLSATHVNPISGIITSESNSIGFSQWSIEAALVSLAPEPTQDEPLVGDTSQTNPINGLMSSVNNNVIGFSRWSVDAALTAA
jgi:aryl-phospho-beta-D-glucosidase BglC (GH1 family)